MSSDDKPTPASSDAPAGLAKSLEERLSFPDDKPKSSGTNPGASTFTPGKFNWADEVTSPSESDNFGVTEKKEEKKEEKPQEKTEDKSLEDSQKDGATPWMNGSGGLDEPEFDVKVTLADLQENPNNPLFSVKTFDQLDLREELIRGISIMNFHKPSKIQERALPLLLKNPAQNLIGQSQSGTGKTAAFVLNMLSRVDLTTSAPQCLVLAPTRELAKQISGVAQLMGTFLTEKGLKITEAIPDPSKRNQKVEGQVIVGTPGTVMDMIRRRQLNPAAMKNLTLDEADNMLDMQGMGDQCKKVKQLLPKTVQVVLFSATFSPEVLQFASVFAPNANQLTLEVEKLTVKGIKQMYLDCSSDQEKYDALVKFYGLMTIASSIIFVKRRDTAAAIERRMTDEGHKVAQLSGALDGNQRDEVFQRFRSGEAKVLITTNVLARGIDVQTVTMVINYDIPETVDGGPDYETYLHRIGRTGRFGRTGAALSFVHDRRSWENLMAICKHFNTEPTKLDTSDWDALEKMLKAVMRNSRNDLATNDQPGSKKSAEEVMDD